MAGFTVLAVDDAPAYEGWGGADWLPIRHTLGVTAFGHNGYRAPEAGIEVIEPHDESEQGHQELYVVLRGHATFALDGEEVEAPAGTLVFIEDPALRRVAVAREPGTTVLAFGGEAGAFTPSEWEGRWLKDATPR